MLRIHGLAGLLLCALLGACAGGSPTHYYSLMRPADALGRTDTTASTQDINGNSPSAFALTIGSMTVPDQVDKAQIVLTEADSAQVNPLNSYLWASTLSDEIRAALGDDLSRQLKVIEIPARTAPATMKRWGVDMRVQRFESVYGQHVFLEATWRLTPVNLPGRKEIVCRAQTSAPVGDGMTALVEGHQRTLSQMATLIAAAIRGGASAVTAKQQDAVAAGPSARILGCV